MAKKTSDLETRTLANEIQNPANSRRLTDIEVPGGTALFAAETLRRDLLKEFKTLQEHHQKMPPESHSRKKSILFSRPNKAKSGQIEVSAQLLENIAFLHRELGNLISASYNKDSARDFYKTEGGEKSFRQSFEKLLTESAAKMSHEQLPPNVKEQVDRVSRLIEEAKSQTAAPRPGKAF